MNRSVKIIQIVVVKIIFLSV